MDVDALTGRIKACILPVLESASLELIDISLKRTPGGAHLVVLADRSGGGITVEECARLNRALGVLLDEQDVLPGPYTLEVSSPGLDRRLSTAKDFMTRLGKPVRFFLAQPVEGKIEWQGIVRRIGQDCVEIDALGSVIIIPLGHINKAHEVLALGSADGLKKGKGLSP